MPGESFEEPSICDPEQMRIVDRIQPARLVSRPRPASMNDILGDEATAEFARTLREESNAAARRRFLRQRGILRTSVETE
jgi:hypothetical protein